MSRPRIVSQVEVLTTEMLLRNHVFSRVPAEDRMNFIESLPCLLFPRFPAPLADTGISPLHWAQWARWSRSDAPGGRVWLMRLRDDAFEFFERYQSLHQMGPGQYSEQWGWGPKFDPLHGQRQQLMDLVVYKTKLITEAFSPLVVLYNKNPLIMVDLAKAVENIATIDSV